MSGERIVIVDDSTFSIAFIRNILEENGLEVVGEATSLEEVKEVVREQRPTLVTMDMTIPGTDGLECTRAIHEIDKTIKVIVISSMMDDELVKQARKNKVSAYLQKPVDAEELMTVLKRVLLTEELYQFLKNENFAVYQEALKDGLNKMTKTTLTYKEEYTSKKEFASMGVTALISIIGKFSGRMIIDLSKETARNLTTAMLRKEPKNNEEIIAAIAEFTNIVAGNACSMLNRKSKALGLRVAPPSILHGESLQVSAHDFTTTTAVAETGYGDILLNVGFQRGDDTWM